MFMSVEGYATISIKPSVLYDKCKLSSTHHSVYEPIYEYKELWV